VVRNSRAGGLRNPAPGFVQSRRRQDQVGSNHMSATRFLQSAGTVVVCCNEQMNQLVRLTNLLNVINNGVFQSCFVRAQVLSAKEGGCARQQFFANLSLYTIVLQAPGANTVRIHIDDIIDLLFIYIISCNTGAIDTCLLKAT